eukprot:scaffold20651_cov39-Prasinocladus_malaysianus.AAC.3
MLAEWISNTDMHATKRPTCILPSGALPRVCITIKAFCRNTNVLRSPPPSPRLLCSSKALSPPPSL